MSHDGKVDDEEEEEMLDSQTHAKESSGDTSGSDREMADVEDNSEDGEDNDEEEEQEDSATSELDDEELDRRKQHCMTDMHQLEKQFAQYKEQLYKERLQLTDRRLEDIKTGCSPEYLRPLAQLQEEMQIRTQVAGVLRELRILSIKNKFESEELAAQQNFESDKTILVDDLREELMKKIRQLEEDRHNIDINSTLSYENHGSQRRSKQKLRNSPVGHTSSSERRRKPTVVSGPYIVYQLKEADVLEDWAAIKKSLKQKHKTQVSSTSKMYKAHVESGRLWYRKQLFQRGQEILLDIREGSSPTKATITAITNNEIMVRHSDGHKSKLFISQLQRGKYTIDHPPSNRHTSAPLPGHSSSHSSHFRPY